MFSERRDYLIDVIQRPRPEIEPAARRALCLVLEAVLASDAGATPADLDAVRALFPLVDDERLSPRYLQALVELASGSG